MGIKLVIVDDAPFILEVVRHIAKKTDIEIVGEAKTGVEAIEVVLGSSPDVVLMDIVMPEMSGIEATKEILLKNPNLKIIACSTLDNEVMIMKAIDAGCWDYIVKPFNQEQLIHKITATVKASSKPSGTNLGGE